MSKIKLLSVLVAVGACLTLVGVASRWAQATGPTISFQGTYPLTVEAGDYDLTYLVLDFAPGAAIPLPYRKRHEEGAGIALGQPRRNKGNNEPELAP
mgnify:CR=1 FL=1